MANHLLIVESPSKAKTLKKYLGADFDIVASYGHVRSLIRKNGSVDVDNHFAMKYQIIAKNSKHVDAIVKAVEQAQAIYLATDPDREGEAIAWHLLEILKERQVLAQKPVKRVAFYEITQSAVKQAIAQPRDVSLNLVNAQQARTALDYLVGFNLSPLLWRKIRQGLSAGRVQSPALRMICEREVEIKAFKSQEYWSVHCDSHKQKQRFTAKLSHWQGKKLTQFALDNAQSSQAIVDALQGKTAMVIALETKRKQRHPAAPFTTSTLQQEAVRKLGMTTDKTMRTAQQLYEGINIDSGTVGLITYMRTDSVALANEAVLEILDYVAKHFEAPYLPKQAIVYKSKIKNAQEAHEAIRPTSIYRTPESLKRYLSPEQFKLYEMIWKRSLACQMAAAKFDLSSVDIQMGDGVFRATGQVLVFPGYIAVYQEDSDDMEDEKVSKLPSLELNEVLPVDKLYATQHFTQAPPRYTEASLVKALEEYGIGRPSTYASIVSTLKEREYVIIDKKRFAPTDIGDIVNKFLTEHFAQYVDYHFTAHLEDKLDDISNGKRDWIPLLEDFWQSFHRQVEEKQSLRRKDVTQEALDEACPKCSQPLVIRFGRRGRFVGCSTYPGCDYARNLGDNNEQPIEVVVEGRSCPDCGHPLVIKSGNYGKFIGCSHYPQCKHIEPLEKPKDTGVMCPECRQASLLERKSRYGKIFYGCHRYPHCRYAVWNLPINEPCPKCQWPILTLKTTKRRGTEKVCPCKNCAYVVPVNAVS